MTRTDKDKCGKKELREQRTKDNSEKRKAFYKPYLDDAKRKRQGSK